MKVKTDELTRAVHVAIDMNRTDTPLLAVGDSDTLTLDTLIKAKLPDALRLVEMEAPLFMLESGHILEPGEESTFFIGSDGKGFLVLPDDFMRLISFQMSDWDRPVFEAITESDPIYRQQASPFKGICGNPERPVVALVRRAEGKVLEFYSCRNADATIAQACYLPIPRIDADGALDIPEDLYSATVYRAASLVLAALGDQLATTMLELSKSMI